MEILTLIAPGEGLLDALRGSGFSIEAHDSVDEARASLAPGTVVVIDGPLAGSGAAIERLCSDGVAVVAVVDASDVMTAVRASSAGASDVVFRPLRPAELLARIRSASIRMRPRAELRLRTTNDALRRIVETAGVAIWILNGDRRTVYANARLAEMLGHTIDALGAVVADELVHEHQRARFVETCARTLVGEQGSVEVALLHADGTELWASLRSTPINIGPGEPDGVLVVATDVTTRRRTENAALRGEARYRALVEAAPDSILILNADGTIELAHECGLDALVGSSFFDRVPAAHRARARALLSRALETDAVEVDELEVYCVSEPRRHICRLRRIDEGFGPDRVVGFLTDVSEIHRVRAELQASQARLVQGQRMEAVGRLAGGLAHDFNNLLSVIGGCASFVGAALRRDDPIVEDVQRIVDAAGRAETLTRQLLAFSRRQHLRPSSVDLGSVVQSMERMLLRLLGEHILLRVKVRSTPRVFVDPGQIEQVVLNLASNAREWMGTGGVLEIGTGSRELDAASAECLGVPPGRYATLSVADTGGGLTADEIPQVFEPFFGREAPSDHGLVLASVYGIVQQSHGTIHVESTPGRGTTFTVLLPEYRDLPAIADSRTPSGRDQSILVVEDDSQVRYVIVRALQSAGFRTLAADGPEQAMSLIEGLERPLDLLVTDVVMPGMSGAQLARCLEPRFPTMRVLYVTGYLDDTTLRHGLAHQAEGVLAKPFAPAVLVRRVTELLEGRA